MKYERTNQVIISMNTVDGCDEASTLIISPDTDYQFKMELKDSIKGYTNVRLTDKIIGVEKHISIGLLVSNILTTKKYTNVLFIPSFRHGNYPRLTDENYAVVKSNAAQHMAPIINRKFDCAPNIYVAYPEGHTSMYHDLMLEFGVQMVESNGMYSMGAEDYSITVPEGVKFDAVYLAGHDVAEEVTFSGADIKGDFASYCNEDFDLIDHYEDDRLRYAVIRENPISEVDLGERLTGTSKSFDDIYDFVATNTLSETSPQLNSPAAISAAKDILSKSVKVY